MTRGTKQANGGDRDSTINLSVTVGPYWRQWGGKGKWSSYCFKRRLGIGKVLQKLREEGKENLKWSLYKFKIKKNNNLVSLPKRSRIRVLLVLKLDFKTFFFFLKLQCDLQRFCVVLQWKLGNLTRDYQQDHIYICLCLFFNNTVTSCSFQSAVTAAG